MYQQQKAETEFAYILNYHNIFALTYANIFEVKNHHKLVRLTKQAKLEANGILLLLKQKSVPSLFHSRSLFCSLFR